MREIRVAKHAKRRRRLTVDQVGLDRVGVRAQQRRAIGPIIVDSFADGESLLGKISGRLQQLFESPSSRALEQNVPGVHGSGSRDGIDTVLRHLFRGSALGEMLGSRPGGRPAAAVQRHQFLFFRQPRDDEHIAADSRAAGFDDVHDGRGRHCGVDRVTAIFQYLQTSLRPQRLAGRHDSVAS